MAALKTRAALEQSEAKRFQLEVALHKAETELMVRTAGWSGRLTPQAANGRLDEALCRRDQEIERMRAELVKAEDFRRDAALEFVAQAHLAQQLRDVLREVHRTVSIVCSPS